MNGAIPLHSATGLATITTPWGDTLQYHPSDHGLDAEMRTTGNWWPYEIDVLTELTPYGGTVLDIGASLGYLTCLFAHLAGPSGTVHAVEPSRHMSEVLQSNLHRNRHHHATVAQQALGDRDGLADLWESRTNLGRHSLLRANVPAPRPTGKVRVETPDQYWRRAMQSKPIDVLKVDVEGNELSVLLGAAELLAATKHVWIELWPQGLAAAGTTAFEVYRRLSQSGFQLTYHSLVTRQQHPIASEPDHWRAFEHAAEYCQTQTAMQWPIVYAHAMRPQVPDSASTRLPGTPRR